MIIVILESAIFFLIGYLALRTYLRRLIYLSHFICILFAFSISCTILLEVFFHVILNDENLSKDDYPVGDLESLPIILWWTSNIGRRNEVRKCYNRQCYVSSNRNLLNRSTIKAFAFYGSDINPEELPLPRLNALWALLHEESPKNTPILLSVDFLQLFNFTSTFSRTSHLPLNALHLDDLDDIRNMKYFVPIEDKNDYIKNGLGTVLYIQSDCDTLTDRDTYVKELSKYISVDSYGTCLNNAKLPEKYMSINEILQFLVTSCYKDFLHFIARYKFTLAIENAVCDDYITEKLWRPLMVGSVPIYFGSPTIRDWLPNHDSAILISDFNDPLDLSNYLKKLNSLDNLYELMVAHKMKGTISNLMLKNIIKSRRWKWHADNKYVNFIDEFECQICLYLYGDKRLTKTTNKSHYSCAFPNSLLTNEKNKSNHWNEIFRYEVCKGKAISSFISKHISYIDADVQKKINELINENEC